MWLNNFSSLLARRTYPGEKTTTRKVACSEGILFGRIKNTIFLFSHHLWCWKQRETGVERRIIMGAVEGGGRGKAECQKTGCLSHPLPFSPFWFIHWKTSNSNVHELRRGFAHCHQCHDRVCRFCHLIASCGGLRGRAWVALQGGDHHIFSQKEGLWG